MISLYEFQWTWGGWTWFNLGGPCVKVGKRPIFVWLWNAFNRVTDADHWWGVGVMQIGRRHLCYIGHNGISIAFIGKTR
jgi:hypothetical protein